MGVIIVKKRQSSEIPTPPVGKSTLFIDIADDLLKKKDSNGNIVAVGSGAGSGIKYVWNNVTEQNNQIGMAMDDVGMRNDLLNRPVYQYNGSSWVQIYLLDGDGDKIGYTHVDHPSFVNVKNALDYILYSPMMVTLSGGGNFEKGQTVQNVYLTWVINNTPITQSLNHGIGSILPGITNYDALNVNLITDTTYTILADDGISSDSDDTIVKFLSRARWGIGSANQSSDLFILGLASSVLTDQKERSINLNIGSGQRGYYAIPSSFGVPIFTVGGIEGGFELVAEVTHINTFGHSELYRVYQTEQENLGSLTVVIL